jgi:hypothetical protein
MLNAAVDVRLGLIVLAWLIYFGLHSLLASLWLKRWVVRAHPDWMPGYRLFFNLCATILLLPPLALTYWERGPWLWEWTEHSWWIANGLAGAALAGLLWSLRWYDGSEFLGIRQWPLAAAPLCAPSLVQPGAGTGLDQGHGSRLPCDGGDDHPLFPAGI